MFFVSIFSILFFLKIEIISFSIISMLCKNFSRSLLTFKTGSFLIEMYALCKLSSITRFSFAKLKPPKSIASLISLSNLFLWFSSSASDLSNFSSVSLSFSSALNSFSPSFLKDPHFFVGYLRHLNCS